MKSLKFILFFIFPMFCLFPLQAKKVNVEKAEKVASFYASKKQLTKTSAKLTLVHTEFSEQGKNSSSLKNTSDKDAIYYIFSKGNNLGFVIVAADDVVVPVLGSVDSGDYDSKKLPPNFVYWMGYLSDEIAEAINSQIEQTPETKALWDGYLNGNTSLLSTRAAVSPLVKTEWNQYSPYNNLCPGGSVTGCVATAMAQIMKYHNWPTTRTATIPGYTTTSNKYNVPAITGSTTYNWGAMTNTYSSGSSSASQAAVATLMYHCGVSVEMNYTPSSSGAPTQNVGTSLYNYFQYDGSVQYKERKYYSPTAWENILRAEINAGRPILYAGFNSSSGHAFVCDGYDNSGKFHFNWGWGGYLDGYFVSTSLNPGTGGAGAGAGTYNEGQGILINMKPNAGGVAIPEMKVFSGKNIVSSKTSVDKGEAFSVNVPFHNAGLFSFSGDVGVALVDANDNIKSIIGQRSEFSLNSGSYYPSYNINTAVPTTIAADNYYLRGVAKPTGATSWIIVTGSPGYVDKPAITVTNNVRTHGMKIKSGSALSATKTLAKRGETFTVSACFINRGTSTFTGDLGVALVNNSDQILEVIGTFRSDVSLDPNYSWTSPFDASCIITKAIPEGTYKIRAIAKPDGENWSVMLGETGVTDVLPFTVAGTLPDESNLTLSYLNSQSFSVTPNPIMQNSSVTIDFGVYNDQGNTKDKPFIGDIELVLCDLNGEQVEVIGSKKITIYNDGYRWNQTISSSNITSPGGTYLLRLYQESIVGDKKKVGDRGSYKNDMQITVVGTPPNVTAVSPANGAKNVAVNGQLTITFDEPMNPTTGIGDVTLGGGVVSTEYKTWSAGNTVCTIPYSNLDYSTTYTFNISGFKDASGNVMKPVTSGYSFTTVGAPAATSWNPQGTSTDWNNVQNWTNGVPGSTTNVTIPKSGSYPVLTTNMTVNNVYFRAGAELGRQDLLSYQKAFVEYNFGIGVRDSRFHMLSIPLKEAYPGDFSFGSYPNTYLQTFEVNDKGRGRWVSASGGSTGKLTAGTGFVISLDSDNASDKGLGLSGGILRLPFFDSESNVAANVHPNHTYSGGNSTFTNPYGSGSYSVARSADGYRLAGQAVNIDLQFGMNKESVLALVGNPFMSTIDFSALYNDNSGLIKNNYQIWTKVGDQEGYAGYNAIGGNWGLATTPSLNNQIAPLQGFIVEQNTETGSLGFNLPNIMSSTQGVLVYDTNLPCEKLDIVATNTAGTVRTFIVKHEEGTDGFGVNDARKLMNKLTAIPEVYTIKPSDNGLVAVGANIVNSDAVEYPLGLATTFSGDVTLTFSGMDNYDANIYFTDKMTGKSIELTDLGIYEYTFSHHPVLIGEETIATDDRFYISIAPKNSLSLPETLYQVGVYNKQGFIHTVSNGANPIKELAVYNSQGERVYQSSVNASSHITIRKFVTGVYIVQVKTERGVETKKIMIN